jgi:outer membrane receptor for Fe3+-dicitrate
VAPSVILNASAGCALVFRGVVVRPQLHVQNVLDHQYLLKGAFCSGRSVGRPRSIQVRVNVGA